MPVILWGIAIIALARWYYLKLKRRRAIRAIMYLQRIAYGGDIAETNLVVLALEGRTVDAVECQTNVMLNQIYSGDRGLAVMYAKVAGFRG